MKRIRQYKRTTSAALIAAAVGLCTVFTGGCQDSARSASAIGTATTAESETSTEIVVTTAPETIPPLNPSGQLLPELQVTVPDATPMPEYLRVGDQHPVLLQLQQRLMELGFMDSDEPTEYFGTQTERAVKIFQRQNGLTQDGVVGGSTYEAIMSPEAKHYAAQLGDSGDDISQIQARLYALGYLASDSLVTGTYDENTLEAVKKLQEVNSLGQDGTVGQETMQLLYSDTIKANFLAFGEKSDLVLAAQKRLKELGYLLTEPDGTFGLGTQEAVKQFQSRNDQIVDGYLGPGTRVALDSPDAKPMGLRLGDTGDTVTQVQQLLSKYGYLASANATGYYGEVTENAVKAFQRQNGLTQDGTVGAMTLASLTGTGVKSAPKETQAPKATTGSSSGKTGSSGSSSGKTGSSGSGSSGSSGSSTPGTGTVKMAGGVGSLLSVASSKLGSPYVWGAKGPNSFDCSGFVYWCLNQVGVSQSYITSSGWRSVGRYTRISNFSDIQAGDIVVVSGHVGIAAGGGTVIDASSSNGRVIHHSLSSWWANNFIVAWRIFG